MPVLMSIISKTLCTDGLFLEGMKQTWKVLKFVLIQIRADSEFTLVSHAPRNVPKSELRLSYKDVVMISTDFSFDKFAM